MNEQDAEFLELFRDEATERLDNMVDALLTLEAGGGGADAIDSIFRDAHTIKGASGLLGLDDVRMLAHAMEDVLSTVRDSGVFPADLTALLLRATDVLRAQVTGAGEGAGDLLEELAASRAALVGGDQGRREAGSEPEARAEPQLVAGRRALRVPAQKIDRMLELVGEAMLQRRRLEHALGDEIEEREDLADELELGDRLLGELKDAAVGMRTLPLSTIVGPLQRAMRDLTRVEGKDVELVVSGADTELDRVILESLMEPLVHLLRNAVGHGIESPAERERAGKPPRGRIELRAEQRGGLVEVTVADDGRGVSRETIAEARRAGSLVDVLARAGYSTADEVSDLVGRGVGLGAVKTQVQSFGGSVEVRSEPARGMEIVLTLPLALALLEVLLCERGKAVYGVPLQAVEEALTVRETLSLQSRAAIELRGRSLPLQDLAALVGATAPPLGEQPPALVVAAAGRRIVAVCDRLLGEEEVVVKPLGVLAGVEGYLGAAILGDGRVALLLEPAALVRGAGLVGAARHSPVPATGAPSPKVLVVEDSFTVRELQRSILEAAGYRVTTARDGRDALEALARDHEIDLVVTDIEMPELDGLELTRAIRADAVRSSLPVVIVTSRGSDDDRRQGIEAGADAYMAKSSFDQQALLETVERLVGR